MKKIDNGAVLSGRVFPAGGSQIFTFGGMDVSKRYNDCSLLDTSKFRWSIPEVTTVAARAQRAWLARRRAPMRATRRSMRKEGCRLFAIARQVSGSVPVPRANHTATLLGDVIWLFGGYGGCAYCAACPPASAQQASPEGARPCAGAARTIARRWGDIGERGRSRRGRGRLTRAPSPLSQIGLPAHHAERSSLAGLQNDGVRQNRGSQGSRGARQPRGTSPPALRSPPPPSRAHGHAVALDVRVVAA